MKGRRRGSITKQILPVAVGEPMCCWWLWARYQQHFQ